MRVLLDTNVLVSALATRGVCADVLRVVLAEHALVTSEVVLGELTRVLRERFGVPVPSVDEIEAFLRGFEVAAAPRRPSGIAVRDPEDDRALASAIEAGVDLLVTGDRDLLDVAEKAPIRIVSPREFWELLRRG